MFNIQTEDFLVFMTLGMVMWLSKTIAEYIIAEYP